MELRKKVILDVDTGSDDAVALLLAMLSGKLDILGVTVTWGNRCVEDCVANTLQAVSYTHLWGCWTGGRCCG